MVMDEREFKKLLIDLDLSLTEIARRAGVSQWAVTLYFRGDRRSPERRRQIKRILAQRAHEMGYALPEFWPDDQA